MRRQEREIKNGETMIAALERCLVGRIATINLKGFPVIKPVNFVYWKGKIFFHSSQEGEKMEDIRRGSPICFEVDEPISYVAARGPACTASYYYRCVIVKGKAVLMNPQEEKVEIIKKLMEKYQPKGDYNAISEEILAKTAVVEVFIEEMTGKENVG